MRLHKTPASLYTHVIVEWRAGQRGRFVPRRVPRHEVAPDCRCGKCPVKL